jgi:hypothetical protein
VQFGLGGEKGAAGLVVGSSLRPGRCPELLDPGGLEAPGAVDLEELVE